MGSLVWLQPIQLTDVSVRSIVKLIISSLKMLQTLLLLLAACGRDDPFLCVSSVAISG
jgi:hypothetical protein